MRHDDKQLLKDLLIRANNLKDDEFIILARRYGLDNKDPLRVIELSRMFNITCEEVRRKARWSLIKLREFTNEDNIKAYDHLLGELTLVRLEPRE